MTVTYVITGLVLAVYLVLVWLLGSLLQLKSPDVWVLRGGLALVGIGVAGAFLWWRRSRTGSAAAEPVDGTDELAVLLRAAEARLAAARLAQGSRLGDFPIVFVVGDGGSAKTSSILNSGLDPELLAGQVYQDGSVVATPTANLWLTKNTIFAEAGERLRADQNLRKSALPKVQPRRQAPRAAIVFFDAETFTRRTQIAATATARNMHDGLMEISGGMGINFPVYVLFTRMDRLPYFREFIRNLSGDEATQVLGATLPMVPGHSVGDYGEQQGARVGGAFDNLVRRLCDARPELLSRENDWDVQPATYEFPREFRKLRSVVVPFLVELCRPSQLTTAPFLRGFYFSGVRPVTVNEAAPAEAAPEEPHDFELSGATRMFKAGFRAPAPAAPRVAGTRRVPQWVFLSRLFHDVILKDQAAFGASTASTRRSFAQRLLLAGASLLCLIVAAGFTVSYARNRSLETRAVEGARGISAGESTGLDLPSTDALRRLERLRQTVAELSGYETYGAPFTMRWGLYTGSELYPQVRRLYFARFRQLLFGQTQSSMLNALERLPAAPAPQDEYGPVYDTLKAYLITTSRHEKSTPLFLTPVLMRHFTAGRNVDPERSQLAQMQFDFYGSELAAANPYASDNDAAAIERGRRYLSKFAGIERVYQNMLAEAGKGNPPVHFNRRFPGSAETVVDAHEVAGAFTKGGYAFMKDALAHADRYFSGEQWVLGDQTAAGFDRAQVEQRLRDRYESDFIGQWRAYLKAASVVRYASLPDAATKLGVLAGNQSPLLALIWLASQNTGVENAKIASAFQPVQTVVPPASVDRYIAAPNQAYMGGLGALQTSLEQVAAQPGPVTDASAGQVLSNAGAAKSHSRAVAQAFRPDPEGKVDAMVQKLMEDPITYVEALLRTLGPAELNGKGKALCAQLRPVLSKYPFTSSATQQATLAEVNSILRRPDGAIWAFYDASLQRLLPKQGGQYVPAPAAGITVSPAFAAFLNRAAALSDTFYAGGSAEPHLTYTLRPVPSEGIQDLTLRLDGQVLSMSGGNAFPKQFVWPGTSVREARANVQFGGTDLGFANNQGLWAVFQFFEEAERWQPVGGAYQLEWVVRAGKNPFTLPSGRPLTVRFELNMGGAPPVFEKAYLSRLGCVAEVAK